MRFNRLFAFAFAALMLVFVGYTVWHAVMRSDLEAAIARQQRDLDTSTGRVNKQKYERAKAALEIPGSAIARDCLIPLTKESAVWKDRRDALKGDAGTIKAAAQDAEDAMKAAESAWAEAVRGAAARLEAAMSAAGQEP